MEVADPYARKDLDETITLSEYGESRIPNETFAKLVASPLFWMVVEAGIVQVRKAAAATIIKAFGWTGSFQTPFLKLEILPRAGTDVDALRSVADDLFPKIVDSYLLDEGLDERFDLLADFASILGAYVKRGGGKVYRIIENRSPFIRGALDVPGTVREWALGRRQRFAMRHVVLDDDTEINRIVVAAIDVVTRGGTPAARSEREAAEQVVALRRVFACPPRSGGRASAEAEASRLAGSAKDSLTARLLRICSAIFGGAGSYGDAILATKGCVFVNTARLFEAAVRAALTSEAGTGLSVAAGTSFEHHLLFDTKLHRADPDFVLSRGQNVIAAGDAKYRSKPSAATEVQQILAHGEAFSAPLLFLVDHGISYEARRLGRSRTGRDVMRYTVRSTALRQDVAGVVADLRARDDASTGPSGFQTLG